MAHTPEDSIRRWRADPGMVLGRVSGMKSRKIGTHGSSQTTQRGLGWASGFPDPEPKFEVWSKPMIRNVATVRHRALPPSPSHAHAFSKHPATAKHPIRPLRRLLEILARGLTCRRLSRRATSAEGRPLAPHKRGGNDSVDGCGGGKRGKNESVDLGGERSPM